MNRYIKLSYILLAVLFLSGCADRMKLRVGETRLVETQGLATYKYLSGGDVFIGVSKELPDEAAAVDDAALHARRQIAQSLEIELSSETINRYLVKETNDALTGEFFMDAKTKTVARNILQVKPEGYYIEKWAKGAPAGIEYFYKCWCLVRYSQGDHDYIVGKVVDQLLRLAEPALREGKEYRRQGRIRDALRQFRRVKDLAGEMEGYRGISPELAAQVRDLIIRTEESMSGISILVAVRESIKGKILVDAVVETKLVEALSAEGGFAVKSSLDWNGINPSELLENRQLQKEIAGRESVDLLLVGQASVDEESKISNNVFFARSKMRLKLVEGATGTVIWETAVPGELVPDSRGFANNPQTAAQRALSLADQTKEAPYRKICKDILEALK